MGKRMRYMCRGINKEQDKARIEEISKKSVDYQSVSWKVQTSVGPSGLRLWLPLIFAHQNHFCIKLFQLQVTINISLL